MSRPNINVENLERALNEIVALEAIYGCGEVSKDVTEEMMFRNNGGSQFSVLSTSEWEIAQTIIQASSPDFNSSPPQVALSETSIPALEVEIRITDILDESEKPIESIMRCCLPPGYPDVAAVVNVGPISGLLRSEREIISSALNSKAKAMVSQEVILDLVEEVKSLVSDIFAQKQKIATSSSLENSIPNTAKDDVFGRRWIWVHHIVNTDRRKDILQEAVSLKLNGYLKSGYPGVILVEGNASACDEFVSWVKGNKSRPGGFGRNWGHHVRGHVDFSERFECRLHNQFEELEDMATLGRLCKDAELECEFLEFVMQHR